MVYRKRRNRRRNGYRRAHRYMNTAAKALSIARSVKAIVNSEKKTFDTNLTGFISQTGSIDCLTKAGYKPVGSLFLVELEFLNPKLDVPHNSLIKYDK